jgi:hypothetical protein
MIGCEDGVLWVCNSLSLSRKSNKTLAVLGEHDDRGVVRAPSEFSMTRDPPYGDARIGRTRNVP